MKKKITSLTITIVILTAILITAIYFSFFSYWNLRQMGYNNHDSDNLMKYKLTDRVDSYNKSLLYALDSKSFDDYNLEYYLLFNSEYDLTSCINSLAVNYGLDTVIYLKENLTQDELIDFSQLKLIQNFHGFVKLHKLGYKLEDCVVLVNDLSEESVDGLVSLGIIENPQYYKEYLDKGYDDITIQSIFNLSEDIYNDFAKIKYFPQLGNLIANDEFNPNLLARYLMYMDENDVSEYQAILYVNDDKDVIEEKKLDYSEFYEEEPNQVTEITIDCLVNKANKLVMDANASSLITLEGSYRGNNQPVNNELAEAFVQLADYIRSETNVSIIAYNGYQDSETIEALYDKYMKASGNKTKSVDSICPKAYYSEHETGLAIDIAESGYSYNDLYDSKIYNYLNQFAGEYGFILRYPEGKEFITGYAYTPYHYRYVGVEISTLCSKYNWTLEEYTYLYK